MAARKHWRCLTCGFAWPKEEPPGVCPVCGAPGDQFAPIGRGKGRFFRSLLKSLTDHVHPIVVHLPNGALPAGILFLYLALLTGSRDLERAAFFILVLVLVSTPVAGVTGYFDWKGRYGGRKVPIFHRKIGLAAGLFALELAGVVLRGGWPGLFGPGAALWWVYLVLVTATLPLLVLLGHWGGNLVFEWRKFPKATAAGEGS